MTGAGTPTPAPADRAAAAADSAGSTGQGGRAGAPAAAWRHDVFVSYASEDRPRAAAIVDALQRRGLRVWWDRELAAGDAFSPVIQAELDAACVVAVLWSRASVSRRFVREEAVRAGDRLLPVLLDDTLPPLGFGQASAVDLRRWRGDELALELDPLLEGVAGRLATSASTAGPPRGRSATPWELARSLYLDLKTRIVLVALVAATAVVWLLRGTERWRQDDLEWLAGAVALLGLAWAAWRAGRLARARRWPALALGAAAAASVALGALAWHHYALPRFPTLAAGIAVARFAGEGLGGATQRAWLAHLQEQGTDVAAVAVVDIRELRRLPPDDGMAGRLARTTNAVVLLWGRPGPRPAMTFAGAPGFVPGSGLALAGPGTVGLAQAPADVLSRPVVIFVAAYGAFARGQYDLAQRLLDDLLQTLGPDSSAARTAVGGLRATTHLLLGNIAFRRGCLAGVLHDCMDAAVHYQAARDAADPKHYADGNPFVEASNNLAVVETRLVALADRQAREAGLAVPPHDLFETARSTLADAARVCDAQEPPVSLACTVLAYNRAVAAATARQFAQALELLGSSCSEASWQRLALGPDASLPARCAQQSAYAAAKLGEAAATPDDAARWFDKAARHLQLAEARLPPKGADDLHPILAATQGRVAVGRGDYAGAAARLAPLVQADAPGGPVLAPDVAREHPNLDGPEIAALWQVARACAGAAPAAPVVLPEPLGNAERTYLAAHLRRCHPTAKEE